MSLFRSLSNRIWRGASLRAARRFRRALAQPRAAQERILNGLIRANRNSEFGREHGFSEIGDSDTYRRRVPVRGFSEFRPWIDRITSGEAGVLTTEPVLRMIPTSGVAGELKLVPWTRTLSRQFRRAWRAWLGGLFRADAALAGGTSYFSVGVTRRLSPAEVAIPVGFHRLPEFIGAGPRWLAEQIHAVPAAVSTIADRDDYFYASALHLLAAGELRLIAVRQPSFLELLLDTGERYLDQILSDLEAGRVTLPSGTEVGELPPPEAAPVRARALREAGLEEPARIWPDLGIVLCRGDGGAEPGIRRIARRFRDIRVEPIGLTATEGVVSVPFGGDFPVSVHSHFYEFIDDDGEFRGVDQLEKGSAYDVVVTTGGGLWRYRLGDRVRVTGFVGETPSVRFVGRSTPVSDRVGEAISSRAVTELLDGLREKFNLPPGFAMLAPDRIDESPCYTLYIETDVKLAANFAAAVEFGLARLPGYRSCREEETLEKARVFRIEHSGLESYLDVCRERGLPTRDVAPVALSLREGWSEIFAGRYVSVEMANF